MQPCFSSANGYYLDMADRKRPYTTTEVAEIIGVHPRQVRHLAQKHRIGTRFGRDWLFTAADVRKFKDRPQIGRPPNT